MTEYARHEVAANATRYTGHLIRLESGAVIVALATGWTENGGQWIGLIAHSVSWDYLTEKVPALRDREGDKEGWVLLFKDMGIEVFN